MWTSEQGEHERAINDIKYPKPKCRIAYCGKNVEPFNDMLCFQHTQSKNPMEEKGDGEENHTAWCKNCKFTICKCGNPDIISSPHQSNQEDKSKECCNKCSDLSQEYEILCINTKCSCHKFNQEDKDCPNKGKVGGCPLCFNTHHGEKDFQEDKDWEIEFSRHWIESEPFICTQKGRENAENRIKNFIKKTKQESYEEGVRDLDFIKKMHEVELDAISCKSLEDFIVWSENRKVQSIIINSLKKD